MSDLSRLLVVYEALDDEAGRRPAPTIAEIEGEIRQLVGESWRYGVSAEQFVEDCHSHSLAFWCDWFAMDRAAERTGAARERLELSMIVAKVEAAGPKSFLMDLPLLENRFQFQRWLKEL